jgi:4-hydroxy-3-methylbut-2-en-1-yl diphosphate synthase IspG/GcpE
MMLKRYLINYKRITKMDKYKELKKFIKQAKEVYIGVPVVHDVHYIKAVKSSILTEVDNFYLDTVFDLYHYDFENDILYFN